MKCAPINWLCLTYKEVFSTFEVPNVFQVYIYIYILAIILIVLSAIIYILPVAHRSKNTWNGWGG